MKNLENKITSPEKPAEEHKKEKDMSEHLTMTKELVESLMALGCHFGHPKLDPKAKKEGFVLYKLNGCYMINLDKTLENLKIASKLIFQTVSRGEKILFLTTNGNLKESFKETALQCGEFYINVRYQPGTLTNYGHFLDKKKRLETSINELNEASLTKKEKKVLKNKRKNTEEYFEGLTDLESMPKLVVLIGGEKEYKSIVEEAKAMNIGVITLNDTDVPPVSGYNTITIPCNTKSVETVKFILKRMAMVILEGYEEYMSANKRNSSPKPEGLSNKMTQATLEQKMMENILEKAKNNTSTTTEETE